jgi:hypothetical protein
MILKQMTTTGWLLWLILLWTCPAAATDKPVRLPATVSSWTDLRPARPLVIAADGPSFIMVGREDGMLHWVNLNSQQVESSKAASRISDAVRQGHTGTILLFDPAAGELISCRHDATGWIQLARQQMDLPMASPPQQRVQPVSYPDSIRPVRLAASLDGTQLCVSSPWQQSVWCFTLDDRGMPLADSCSQVRLKFFPGHIAALPDGGWLIADAYGGHLAVVRHSTAATSVESAQTIFGHHIGGIDLSPDGQSLLITHQVLSRVAHSTRDDIHWGSVMQNVVSLIDVSSFRLSKQEFDRQRRVIPLGDTGNAAGDPGPIIFREGGFLVASRAANRVWVTDSMSVPAQDITVGDYPDSMAMLDHEHVAVANLLQNTVHILNLTALSHFACIGSPPDQLTSAERGERLFFSGRLAHDRWMSCSSCHVDGHTSDLLPDTLGDHTFGSPKKIPSLFGVADTGPWGWLGNKSTLQDQVRQSLESTMHGGVTDAQTIDDLTAFLTTLQLPEPRTISPMHPGRKIFLQRGCTKCHSSPHFTSAATYDVGIDDEAGHSEFNPPSLRFLRLRSRYLHDGSFDSLEELLQSHPPTDKPPLQADDRRQLVEYLLSL